MDRELVAKQQRMVDKAVEQFTDLQRKASAGGLFNQADYEPAKCSGCGAVEFVVITICRMQRKKSDPENLAVAAVGKREGIFCGNCQKYVDELGRIIPGQEEEADHAG